MFVDIKYVYMILFSYKKNKKNCMLTSYKRMGNETKLPKKYGTYSTR